MRTGKVLLAAYDCTTVRVLPDCFVDDGRYSFERVTIKEELVRMGDGDSVRARLPTLGAGLGIEVDASLARGSTLDLGIVMAGRWTTGTLEIYAPSLPAACRGATHFVRSVPTGAFALGVGTRARVAAVAEVFHTGVRAESHSDRVSQVRDGDLAACRDAPPRAGPNPGCGAPIRLELQKIDRRSRARAECEDRTDSGGACIEWGFEVSRAPDLDVGEQRIAMRALVALCKRGEGVACTGALLLPIVDVADLDAHPWLIGQACTHHQETWCMPHAIRLEGEGKAHEALDARRRGCGAVGNGCAEFVQALERSGEPADRAERAQLAADVVLAGCRRSSSACDVYAPLFRRGARARGDFGWAAAGKKQCDEGATPAWSACHDAAVGYAFGLGVPRDLSRAQQAWGRVVCEAQRPCDLRKAAWLQP